MASARSISAPRTRSLWLAACAAACLIGLPAVPTFAQVIGAGVVTDGPTRDPNAQLLLQADELVYDNDTQIVTARGSVQLEYDGFNVVAERVSYNQKTRRVLASGNVEIVEPGGNRLYASEIDLTDDFADGFVNALRVRTPDNTRFAAESAERRPGNLTVFNNGVYTACEPCRERPGKAPLWQIKAQRIVLNGVERTVEYRDASFEFFGRPIAYLPYFRHPDATVKRKSGFLAPRAGYKENLGAFLTVPYFWVTSPTTDVTTTFTGYTNQGLLADVEWRQQLETGLYTLRAVGIGQLDGDRFVALPDRDDGFRGLFATTGDFQINPRWNFGWNIAAQTDRTFGQTYDIDRYDDTVVENDIHLRGLGRRTAFDLTAYQFLVQRPSAEVAGDFEYFQDEQPIVHPSLDYNRTLELPSIGAEGSLDVNLVSLSREDLSAVTAASGDVLTTGVNGTYSRATVAAGVRKQLITEGGFQIVPSFDLRGDVTQTNAEAATPNALEDGFQARGMATIGLETSYPVLVTGTYSRHVIEPIAQLFVRPNLSFDGVLANEDAQSLVFDTSNLFKRDKFSGYDRIEGGTRANIGLRYSGSFDNGATIDAAFGQSFHLAGRNPYARTDDLVNVGQDSGLETDRSDYVAGVDFGLSPVWGVDLETRFDEDDLSVRRLTASAERRGESLSVSAGYTFIEAQPSYGLAEERQEIFANADYAIDDEWSVFGSARFDIDEGSLVDYTAGFAYSDECFTLSLAFRETRSSYTVDESNTSITFKIGLRTLSEFGTTFDTSGLTDDEDDGDL